MDYSNIKLFSMMHTRMAYLSERQDVLSQNIANADTPGYRAKDLKKLDFEKLALIEASRIHMRATQPQHMLDGKIRAQQFRNEKSKKTYETTPVKNNIVLEEQSMKMAENNFDYQTTLNLYRKTAQMFKTALGTNQ